MKSKFWSLVVIPRLYSLISGTLVTSNWATPNLGKVPLVVFTAQACFVTEDTTNPPRFLLVKPFLLNIVT